MDVYNFLKNRYDSFHELLKRECEENGWDITFNKYDLFHDIVKVNGHKGYGLNQYPIVNGEESSLEYGWRVVFDHGYIKSEIDDRVRYGTLEEVYFSGTFCDPNGEEYPFVYNADYEVDRVDNIKNVVKEEFSHPDDIPEDVLEEFKDLIEDKL